MFPNSNSTSKFKSTYKPKPKVDKNALQAFNVNIPLIDPYTSLVIPPETLPRFKELIQTEPPDIPMNEIPSLQGWFFYVGRKSFDIFICWDGKHKTKCIGIYLVKHTRYPYMIVKLKNSQWVKLSLDNSLENYIRIIKLVRDKSPCGVGLKSTSVNNALK